MKLDYLDKLLYIVDNGLLESLKENNNLATNKGPTISFFSKLIFKLKQTLLFPIKLIFRKKSKEIESGKIWLIHETSNNYNALLPLKNNATIFIEPNKTIIYRFLLFYKIIYTIPLIIWLFKKNKLKWFFVYYDVLGILEESNRLIKKYKPKKIIFANDINPYQVALKIAAKNNRIHTYYFQHASISKYMPPLDFTVAFLEGQAALDKYKEIGEVNSKIELIGMIKYRNINFKINQNSKVKRIGIALNLLDDIEQAKDVINYLRIKFPQIMLYLRKHPRDSREIIMSKEIILSDSREEGVFEFLNRIDLLIAGESSIHLEASLLNVVPVYFNFASNTFYDVYNYIENDLIFQANDKVQLYEYIKTQMKKKIDVIENTKYYDEYMRTNVDYKKVLRKYGL